MRGLFTVCYFVLALSCGAQQMTAGPAAGSLNPIKRVPIFIDPTLLDLAPLIPPPPPQDGAVTTAELAGIHRIEASRTPADVAAAEKDDRDEDMFFFEAVIGPNFRAESFPRVKQLSQHIRNDAGLVDNPLKAFFARPRPYNFDRTLHPICETNQENSYPSGLSVNGYLYAGLAGLDRVFAAHHRRTT